MAESKPPRKKMELTEAQRKERSDRAKALHEKGVFGGAQKGAGRPSKRAQSQVVDGIRQEGENIFKALKAALKDDSNTVKLKAALAMLEIERAEEKQIAADENRRYENMSKELLLEALKERVQELKGSGINIEELLIGKAKEVPLKVLNEENGTA